MDEASAKELLQWLTTKMRGSVTVRFDGAREPQISWCFPLSFNPYGPNPLEALRAAYIADKGQTTKE